MLDLIVLGQLPGTNIRLGFIPIMILFETGFLYYFLRKYHPKTLHLIAKNLRLDKLPTEKIRRKELELRDKTRKLQKKMAKKLAVHAKKLAKQLKPYEKWLEKKLVHLWHDVFSPKLKFLK